MKPQTITNLGLMASAIILSAYGFHLTALALTMILWQLCRFGGRTIMTGALLIAEKLGHTTVHNLLASIRPNPADPIKDQIRDVFAESVAKRMLKHVEDQKDGGRE